MLKLLDEYIARHPIACPLGLLALVGFLLWSHCLAYDFVWDDDYYIVSNEALRTPAVWTEYFTDAESQKAKAPYPYRALRTLHFGAMTWIMGQPASWLFHLANLLWHIAASYLLFVLLRKFLSLNARATYGHSSAVALLAALAFCVHPIVSEVVPWAKALDDIMSTTFVLAAFIAAWRAWELGRAVRMGSAMGSVVLFALALWSKESVVTLAALFIFPLFVFRDVPKLKFGCWLAVMCGLTLVFLGVRHLVLQYLSQVSVPLSGSYGETLRDMIPVTVMYLRAFIGLPPFHPDYSYMRGGYSFTSLAVVSGVALMLCVAAVWLFAFARRKTWMPVLFGLSWVLLALIPVSNIVPMMQYFAIRFAYLPLVGVIMVVGFVIASLSNRSAHVTRIAVAALVVWACISVGASAKWKSSADLWKHAYEHAPLTSRVVLNYATTLHGAGDVEALNALLDEHGELIKEMPKGKWLLAARVAEKDPQEGLRLLKEIASEIDDEPEFLVYMGVYHARVGQVAEAHDYFVRATETWPSHAGAWKNLGLSLNDLKRFEEAKQAFARAVELGPDDTSAWAGYSFAAWTTKDWAVAEKAFERLVQLQPEDEDHVYWLQKVREEQAR